MFTKTITAFLFVLTIIATTAHATAPAVAEAGILPSIIYPDTDLFLFANYSSADSNKMSLANCTLFKNNVSVVANISTIDFMLDGINGFNSSDYEPPNAWNGVFVTGGLHNKAFSFDGNDDYLLYNISGNFNSSLGSISWWQKNSDDVEFDRVFSWRNNGTNLFEIKNFHNCTEVDVASSANPGTKSAYSQTCGVYTNDSKWHYFVVTYDLLAGEANFTLYADGRFCEKITSALPIMGDGGRNASFAIGANSGLNAQFWKGNISDFQIVNYVKFPEHISAEYVANRTYHSIELEINSEDVRFAEGDELKVGCYFVDNASQTGAQANSTPITVTQRGDKASINFSGTYFTSILDYGMNEKDNLNNFANYTENTQKYIDSGITHIRDWVYNKTMTPDVCYSPWNNTMPTNGTAYDFTCLDKAVNATLAARAYPHITINYCWFAQTMPTLNDSQIADCALYVGNITKHYVDTCSNGSWVSAGNVPCGNLGYWSFGYLNEPYSTKWWAADANYSHAYNETAKYIKRITPEVMFGPADMYAEKYEGFIQNVTNSTLYDFLTYHTYGKADDHEYNKVGMNTTYGYFFVTPKRDRIRINDFVPDKPFWLEEFNLDPMWNPVNPKTMTTYGRAYLASAYYWMIQGRSVNVTFKFDGTGGPITSTTFGSWKGTPDFDEHPYYAASYLFGKYVPKGSKIYSCDANDTLVECMGVQPNSTTSEIVLINKRNATVAVNVSVGGSGTVHWLDINKSTVTDSSGGFLSASLSPYEVMFLSNSNNLSVGISSPSSGQTLTGSSFTLQSSVTHANPLTACYYDFDTGGNVSMTCNSNVIIPYTGHGSHTLKVYAVDVFGGVAAASVSFTSQQEQGGGGSSGGPVYIPPQNTTQNETGVETPLSGEELFVNNPVSFLKSLLGNTSLENVICNVGYKRVGNDCMADTAFYQQNQKAFGWLNGLTPRMPMLGIVVFVVLVVMVLTTIFKKR